MDCNENRLLSETIFMICSPPPHIPASYWQLYRWCTRGIVPKRGQPPIKLEHFKVGGRIFTSIEALNRFFEATN